MWLLQNKWFKSALGLFVSAVKIVELMRETIELLDIQALIVVAEEAKVMEKVVDKIMLFGGIGEVIAESIFELTGKETCMSTLGHLQRGGEYGQSHWYQLR